MSIDASPYPVGLVRKLCLRFFLTPVMGWLRQFGFALAFSVVLPEAALAQTQAAHVHGVADLSVVYEDGVLMVELETPAANVLGFEHEPKNAGESQALSEAMTVLNTPDHVIVLAPPCKLKQQQVVNPFPDMNPEVEPRHSTDHAADDEDHENHEVHAHHEEHLSHKDHESRGDHEQQDHDHNNEAHQEFHMVYQWHCSANAPIVITLKLFERFPGFEKVNVQWLAFGRQSAEVLDKEHTKVEIGP